MSWHFSKWAWGIPTDFYPGWGIRPISFPGRGGYLLGFPGEGGGDRPPNPSTLAATGGPIQNTKNVNLDNIQDLPTFTTKELKN